MDIHNLATLFGPNILRKTKGGQEAKDLHGEASDYVEESRDVITVVEKLIEYDQELFQVRASSFYIKGHWFKFLLQKVESSISRGCIQKLW